MSEEKEYADYPGRTWAQRMDDDRTRLLAVARAAELILGRKGHPVPCEEGQIFCDLHKALAAVEDLL